MRQGLRKPTMGELREKKNGFVGREEGVVRARNHGEIGVERVRGELEVGEFEANLR